MNCIHQIDRHSYVVGTTSLSLWDESGLRLGAIIWADSISRGLSGTLAVITAAAATRWRCSSRAAGLMLGSGQCT